MSSLTVRTDFSALRTKLANTRLELLPAMVPAVVDAVRSELNDQWPEDRAALIKTAEWHLDWIEEWLFHPVRLKGERREQFPDLEAIWRARVVRRQPTYQGRKSFWVDETKLARFMAQKRRQMVAAIDKRQFKISVIRTTAGARVEIVAQIAGRPVLISREKLKRACRGALGDALRRAGWDR